eukprot:TRINITY_DN7025_c0_g1_i1.p1 TRINITY_DN7025_c0_g1~~TRINITY_DN7025_c0_g1_i1.p1  ORF type:complete len:249 (+),score=32.61 TRINITY_DN7025_c0_g1_i1:12-758(+)
MYRVKVLWGRAKEGRRGVRWYNHERNAPSLFRPSVGAIIFKGNGRLLCGKRIDLGFWQFPQGGMHPEEDPVEAALREIQEEVGLTRTDVKLVEYRSLPTEKFTYDRPMFKDNKRYDGQEQRYIIFRLLNDALEASAVNLQASNEPPEFSEVAFLTWDELISRSIPSRTFIYARLRNTVKPIIGEYLAKERSPGAARTPGIFHECGYVPVGGSPAGVSSALPGLPRGSPPPLTYFATSSTIPELSLKRY